MNMLDISPTVSIVILNVNGLNVPIRRDCQSGLKKQIPTLGCLQDTQFKFKFKVN